MSIQQQERARLKQTIERITAELSRAFNKREEEARRDERTKARAEIIARLKRMPIDKELFGGPVWRVLRDAIDILEKEGVK